MKNLLVKVPWPHLKIVLPSFGRPEMNAIYICIVNKGDCYGSATNASGGVTAFTI